MESERGGKKVTEEEGGGGHVARADRSRSTS